MANKSQIEIAMDFDGDGVEDDRIDVKVLHRIGDLAIHEMGVYSSYTYGLTHIPTGWSIKKSDDKEKLLLLMGLCHDFDWSGTPKEIQNRLGKKMRECYSEAGF